MSLSNNSIKLIDWIIGLSFLLTSNEILLLENKWAKPNLLWSKSTFSNYSLFKNCKKWVLNPLKSSLITAEVVVWISRASLIAPANLLSLFLFHWEFFTEEIDKNFWGFSCVSAVNSVKSNSWWFKWEKFFQMSDSAKGLEVSNLWLNWGNAGIDLIELFEFEEGITDWAFVENEHDHDLFCWMKRLL